MSEKLSPCPICGGKATLILSWPDSIPFFGVIYHFTAKCLNCGFVVDNDEGDTGEESATYEWNKYANHVQSIQSKRFVCPKDVKNGIYRFVVTENFKLAYEYMNCEDCENVCWEPEISIGGGVSDDVERD